MATLPTSVLPWLRRRCPRALPELLAAFEGERVLDLLQVGVSTRLRTAHFIGQILHESALLTRCEEDLRYSADRLRTVWPKRFPTLEAAQPYAGNPRALANAVYGGRLGNNAPGDGWTFRGRGLLQITGKENYAKVAVRLKLARLLECPDLACSAAWALPVAAEVFAMLGCWRYADADDVAGVTRRLNGGLTGLASRAKLVAQAKEFLL